ncbi:MAG: eCIS core domain-containing protein, partial [Gammaproteobacteria bacterium]
HNSDQPAQMQAHAFAQGTDIHVAPGQEQHLAHEAWHVVQQKQGRVQPTKQMKGDIPVNDDKGLENEADVMGAKALTLGTENQSATQLKEINSSNIAIQKSAINTVQKEGDEETLPDVEGSQSLMAGTLTISDSDADGESSISFEHPLFTATGTKTAVGDPKKGVREYTLTGEPPAFSTPELAFSLPLPPVPLGIPGL